MIRYRPERLFVQQDSWEDSITSEIVRRLPDLEPRTVTDIDSVLNGISATSDSRAAGKKNLVLTRYRGQFLEDCPGAGAEVCCNYFVLNFASNCPIECTYCVLQSYLNKPAMIVFTNVDDLFAQVQARLSAHPSKIFRVGTGELTDSLVLDDLTHYASRLVPFFASLPNGILELKTKSDRIDNLEALDHKGHTVVSWSVNSKPICRNEELKAATLAERLQGARRCREWGYKIGFHFDPLVCYEGWEKDYREVVEEIFGAVEPGSVAWISLGCMRFTPDLKRIVRGRFPKSIIPHGEFVPGHHGKLRYFRPIRQEMYARMREWIHNVAPTVFVYLCMESRLVWERSFGAGPRDSTGLSCRMDDLVRL